MTFALPLAVIVAGSAAAVEGGDDSELQTETERMVITATRTLTSMRSVGNSISVIDAADLELHQDMFAIDALERVPGLTVRRSGGAGTVPSVFIRGANSNQTLLLVDGVKMHDAAGPNRETQLDHLAVEDIDRIEVLRGPQSVLYGSDAIGGVINIITRRERGPARIRAGTEFGAFQTKLGSLSLRGGDENYYYGASLVLQDSAGYSISTTDTTRDKDGYERIVFSKQVGVGDEMMGVDANFRYAKANSEIDSGFTQAANQVSETDSEQLTGRIAPRLSLFDGVWEQTLAYSANRSTRDTLAFGNSNYVGTIHEVDWQHTLQPVERLVVVVGAEWDRERMDSPTFHVLQTNAYAGYADMQLTPHPMLDVLGGVRVYDHQNFGSKVVGRGAFALNFDAVGVKLRGSAGTGFKAPTLGQLFDDTFGSNNPNLEAEESLGFDFGVSWRGCEERVGLEVGFFHNDIDNLIVGQAPTFVNANVARATTRGIEASMEAQLFEVGSALGDIRLNANYTWLDSESKSARRRLLRRPKHEAYASLTWAPLPRFDLTTSVRWVSARLDFRPSPPFNIIKANDYAVIDVMSSFDATESVELYLRVENLANERYEDVAGFRQPGISAYVGVRIDMDVADLHLPF